MRDNGRLNTLLLVLAALPVVMTIVDFVLAEGNRSLRAEVNQRQQLINQGAQIARTNEALMRHIAVSAINGRDLKLRELLSQNGITINVAPAPAPADGKGP